MFCSDNGLSYLSSPHSAAETIRALRAAVLARGLHIAAEIDHAGDAAKVGLTMRPAEVLIFGDPTAGTPLMIASPTLAIDLPLKALVWQDADGRVWLTYNSPRYLQERHAIPDALLRNISGIATICEEAVR